MSAWPANPTAMFVSLDEFILDTFTRIEDDGTERPSGRPDEIGGGGTYGIIGARIFLPAEQLGMIIDYTPETLPREIKAKLDSYGENVFVYQQRTDGLPTCRAVNRYKGDLRIFEYLSRPILNTPKSLRGTQLNRAPPGLLHFIPLVARTEQIIEEVDQMTSEDGRTWKDTLLVWEPDIPACQPEFLARIAKITPRTHILSPNHREALTLLSLIPDARLPAAEYKALLAHACVQLAKLRPRIGAVLRCGHLGCCYVDTARSLVDAVETDFGPEDVRWIPAFWNANIPGSADKVVDPTGAGNAFVGGLGAALLQGHGLAEAVLRGSVAASFVIEQNGLPNLSKGEDGAERWNGELPEDRVKQMRART